MRTQNHYASRPLFTSLWGPATAGDPEAGFAASATGSHAVDRVVILFRSRHHRTAAKQAEVLLEHLDDLDGDLTIGAVAVITDERIRVRRLPR